MTCTEKTLPNSLSRDSGILQKKAASSLLQSGKLRISRKDLRQHMDKLKAAFVERSVWKKDPLNIAFLGGTQHEKDWVKKIVATKLEPHLKTNFVFGVDPEDSDIRIAFDKGLGAWSYIGTDANGIPKNQPTMNFGWIDDDINHNKGEEYKGSGHVIIHEFGHALGMIHEHQNPKGNPIEWNKPVVEDALRRTNGWNDSQIDNNMFKKYGDAEQCKQGKTEYCNVNGNVNGSEYDKTSVMHYFFPKNWLKNDIDIPTNTDLSKMDIQWLQHYYGKPRQPATPKDEDTGENMDEDSNTTTVVVQNDSGINIIMVLMLFLLVVVIVYLVLSR